MRWRQRTPQGKPLSMPSEKVRTIAAKFTLAANHDNNCIYQRAGA